MKIWKRTLVMALAVLMVLCFAACKSSDPAPAPADSGSSGGDKAAPAPAAKQLKFGQIAHDRAIEWVNYGVMNFEYACNALGVEPVIVDAQNNMEKVLAGMEDLLSKGVDAVSIYSFSPDLDERVAKMARDAGIPIVFENAVPGDNVDRDSVTCCTYYDIGYAVAKFIGEKYPDSTFVYIMGQPGMNITEPYVDGIKAAIADGAKTTMIDTAPTNWTAEEAMNATQNVLQSGKEFDVIFANNEQIAQGVLNALEGAGLKGKIPVVATGGSPLGMEMLRSGDLDATMAAPTSFMGMMSALKLYILVNGGTVEPMTNVPLLPATLENIDDIIPWEPGQKVIDAVGGLSF